MKTCMQGMKVHKTQWLPPSSDGRLVVERNSATMEEDFFFSFNSFFGDLKFTLHSAEVIL